ncbi:membrane protein [Mycobacterium sp. 155]|uniref:phage shock envelope stress response protein PspM n=1 Tax=Mycobacterium sp. 155 TaxID=1157943 RepID=UPI00036CC3C0|nr:membrane protein [Mycobacterium sp. 155]
MAVKTGRVDAWWSLVQRGIDTAADLSGALAEKLSAAADPRAKLLRKRRWTRRVGVFFTLACGFWVLLTAVLATWSTPVWVLIITGVIAAGAAFPATLLWLRYRWLRSEPLPAERPVAGRRLPPWGSAARQPMSTLLASERGMFSLLGVMERGHMLPADELRELTAVANQTARTMAATATEVVSMERTISNAPQARQHLVPAINAFTAQLHDGVRQYNEMVTAAAQLVSAVNNGRAPTAPLSQQRYRNELTDATDRLSGWAQAFDELGRLRQA